MKKYDLTCEVLQSSVVQPYTKCYTLIWLIPKRNVALQCVSTNDQMIQSNVVPPIPWLTGDLFLKSTVLMNDQTVKILHEDGLKTCNYRYNWYDKVEVMLEVTCRVI